MVILVSGGLDSTVLLHWAKANGEKPIALAIRYGQLHEKELLFSQQQAKLTGADFIQFDLADIFSAGNNYKNPLLGKGEMPDGTYAAQRAAKGDANATIDTYIPNRNMVLLAVAGTVALTEKKGFVGTAVHFDDAAGNAYPDCSGGFINSMRTALLLNNVRLWAPFIDFKMTKADIVKKGMELNVDFSKTWSCYRGGETPCRTCATCLDRQKAFAMNGISDPLAI